MGPSLVLRSWELPTIWESFVYGITKVISSKEKGTLKTLPVWLSVIRIPFAMPRFSAETEPHDGAGIGRKEKGHSKSEQY